MVLTTDQHRVKTLLKDTIALLCKNGLTFDLEFSIDAVIGVTLDKQSLFYMSFNETFQSDKPPAPEPEESDEEPEVVVETAVRPSSRKRRKRPRSGPRYESVLDDDGHDDPVPEVEVTREFTVKQELPDMDDDDDDDEPTMVKHELGDTWQITAELTDPNLSIPGTSQDSSGMLLPHMDTSMDDSLSADPSGMWASPNTLSLQNTSLSEVPLQGENEQIKKEDLKREDLPESWFVEDDSQNIDRAMSMHTIRKTYADVKLFRHFIKNEGEARRIVDIPPADLDQLLARFFTNIKKLDGSDYPPNTLGSIQSSLKRHLRDNGYGHDIRTDEQFRYHRTALKARRTHLKQVYGKEFTGSKAKLYSHSQIEKMYEIGTLGLDSPDALVFTMWLNVNLHFGSRGRMEHHAMKWGDVTLEIAPSGLHCLRLQGEANKTLDQINHTNHVVTVKPSLQEVYEVPDNPRCPIKVYRKYLSKRPKNMSDSYSPFYLNPRCDWSNEESVWFGMHGIGKNRLGQFTRKLLANKSLFRVKQPQAKKIITGATS